MIAPLAMLDARQLKKRSSLAMRDAQNFLYGPRKSEFGDSLVKVLLLGKASPQENRTRFLRFDFFSRAARLASDRTDCAIA